MLAVANCTTSRGGSGVHRPRLWIHAAVGRVTICKYPSASKLNSAECSCGLVARGHS